MTADAGPLLGDGIPPARMLTDGARVGWDWVDERLEIEGYLRDGRARGLQIKDFVRPDGDRQVAPSGTFSGWVPPPTAACGPDSGDLFQETSQKSRALAAMICEECPLSVRARCLDAGQRAGETGTWGGEFLVRGTIQPRPGYGTTRRAARSALSRP